MLRFFVLPSFLVLLLALDARAQLVINEVLVDPVGPDSGHQIVELANLTGSAVRTNGWYLCVSFSCAPLPDVNVPSNGYLRVHIGASGTDSAADCYLPPPIWTAYQDLQPTGTILLNRTSCLTCDSDIVDFVSWGGGTADALRAVGVGQWSTVGDTVTLPPGEGQSIAYKGGGDASSSWFRDATPTLGASNGRAVILLVGSGCAASSATPAIVFPGPAVDGSLDFTISVRQGTPGAPCVHLIGLAGTGGLPFLSCPIETTSEIAIPGLLDAQGRSDLAFPLVAPGVYLGSATLWFQAAVIDLGAPNGLFGMTPGGRVRIGN